uniref:Phosphotriesterase-related protein n=1 Tax=Timema shepardi TaxID=629360 RepID=A0A7R9AL44_TIMSH|nr:unnamed protein product [Timema shepardi]
MVLGLVPSINLGRTLTHEHFELDYTSFYKSPPQNVKTFMEDKITLRNAGLVKQYLKKNRSKFGIFTYGCKYNLSLDVETRPSIMREMSLYHQWGGGSVVENTSYGLKRNVSLMIKVQQETSVNIIAGTGYYLASVQFPSVLNMSKESMYDVMFTELTSGCVDYPEVKCGFIGEVASDWPIHDFEKRAIQATAEVQSVLKCPVTFHPGRSPKAPFEIIRIFQEAGGDVRKAVMSHLDRTIPDPEVLLTFAESGAYCQQDLFGTECSHYQFHSTYDMPSDAQRIDRIKLILEDGRADQILISHDIHTKHRLMDFGGHGYSHILNNVLHKMLTKGISQETIDKITIENPKNWICYEQHS